MATCDHDSVPRVRGERRELAPKGAGLAVRLAAVALAVACGAPAPADGLELVVEAPPQLADAAARVRSLSGLDLADVLSLTGLADPGPPVRVVLADEHSTLAAHAPTWVAGYALGALSTIVLFPSRVPSYPDRNLETLLTHELAHILVWRAVRGHPLPRWFDEGLATVAAREWALEDRARTAIALLGERPQSIAEVTASFSGNGAEAARAYALSAAFVRSILSRYGATSAARVLELVSAGTSFEQAFRTATGETLAAAENEFFGHEALWGTWVPFLTSSTALWIGITALALLAIRGRRRRDEALRRSWAAEEAAYRPREIEDADHDDDPSRWN
jgi:hypothetical protein